jgi:hypothetical protein
VSTTNLFVELLVIGSGAFTWLALLVLAALGPEAIAVDRTVALLSAVPALSLVYVLGIVWDRIADAVFGAIWGERLRDAEFADVGAYYAARRRILTDSESLSELLEYGRSRLRICRGWTLNAPLIGAALALYLFAHGGGPDGSVLPFMLLSAGTIVLTIGCWFSWHSLSAAEYRKVREQAAWLEQRGPLASSRPDA